jgi:hypothetical protein
VEVGLTPRMEIAGFDVVCLCYLDPEVLRQARRLVMRLRGRHGGAAARFCLALWGLPPAEVDMARRLTGGDAATVTLRATVDQVLDLLQTPAAVAATADAVADDRIGRELSASP